MKRFLKLLFNKKKRCLLSEKIHTFEGVDVKHMLSKTKKSNKLIIVFPAFGDSAKDAIEYIPSYNYIYALKKYDCNKLFLLDCFNDLPCYCIGHYERQGYEKTVCDLINKVLSDLNIPRENVITFGSSKGGSSALYFAIKYNFGRCLTVAPQILIGSYLLKYGEFTRKVLSNIAEEKNEASATKLDKFILKTLSQPTKTKILYHISKNEDLYSDYLNFMKIKDKKTDVSSDIDGYKEHNQCFQQIDRLLDVILKEKVQ